MIDRSLKPGAVLTLKNKTCNRPDCNFCGPVEFVQYYKDYNMADVQILKEGSQHSKLHLADFSELYSEPPT